MVTMRLVVFASLLFFIRSSFGLPVLDLLDSVLSSSKVVFPENRTSRTWVEVEGSDSRRS